MKAGVFVFVVTICLLVFLCVYGAIMGYEVSKDIDAWIERAEVSAHAEDMVAYVSKAMEGLERYDLTDGYCAIIFKKPDNNLRLHFQAISRINERAKQLATLDKKSAAYQTGIDDLRGTLRDIMRPGFLCATAGSHIWVTILWWIDLVLWIILVVLMMAEM